MINAVQFGGTLTVDSIYRETGNAGVNNYRVRSERKSADGRVFATTMEVAYWGQPARAPAGATVIVQGEISNRSYEDRDGNTVWKTEIRATNVTILGGAKQAPPKPAPAPPAADDDIPF